VPVEFKDYYRVLGVPPKATDEEIKKASIQVPARISNEEKRFWKPWASGSTFNPRKTARAKMVAKGEDEFRQLIATCTRNLTAACILHWPCIA
jgi:hypothetical protein